MAIGRGGLGMVVGAWLGRRVWGIYDGCDVDGDLDIAEGTKKLVRASGPEKLDGLNYRPL